MDMTRVLWAKKAGEADCGQWLPLSQHMRDTAEIAELLWEEWLPRSVKDAIVSGVFADGKCVGTKIALQLAVFLAFVHDVGKSSPVFQSRTNHMTGDIDEILRRGIEYAGFLLKDRYDGKKETRHGLVSHTVLRRNGFDHSVAVVVGGHHGLPPSNAQILTLEEGGYNSACGFDNDDWINAQDELVAQALSFSGLDRDYAITITLSRKAQVLLSGLIIMADWIASNTDFFPLFPLERYSAHSPERAIEAIESLELPDMWMPEWDPDGMYKRRFDFEQTRPMQDAMISAVLSCRKPGIFVLEAPMGEGKTEAALAAAELLANSAGCRGIYFALPSQATSDAMFDRVIKWIKSFEGDEQFSVRLVHGKADINPSFSDLRFSDNVIIDDDDGATVVVHEWLNGRKKGLLADFAIGTIDNVLMSALKQKHLALRHLGLAGKVVIIDECHAYDVFMESYLLMALKWLGAYGIPVIILSATLPSERRKAVINAYLNVKPKRKISALSWAKDSGSAASVSMDNSALSIQSGAYPLITYTDGSDIKQTEVLKSSREIDVEFLRTAEEQLSETLMAALGDGGCAGVVVNTVKKAQRLYEQLKIVFGECVHLLHGQFLSIDRKRKETELINLLGPPEKSQRPNKLIVVGTQIFEQSMDIDFDIMITDLCPIDLLLQRIGRMHRHDRKRPELLKKAVCHVMGADWEEFDRGSEYIYGRYLLIRTCSILPERASLPDDIPRMVAEVYDDDNDLSLPDEIVADYEKAKKDWKLRTENRIRRSKAFQVSSPYVKQSLVGWLDTSVADDSDARGEAAVRDGTDSLEVIVIQKRGDSLCLLPWIEDGQELPRTTPDENLARTISACSVRLPAIFGGEKLIDGAIKELEEKMTDEGLIKGWYQSYWLKGTLCLILDEAHEATLCNHRLRYDKELGLNSQKEEG